MRATNKILGPFHYNSGIHSNWYLFPAWIELQPIKNEDFYRLQPEKYKIVKFADLEKYLSPACLYPNLDETVEFIKINEFTISPSKYDQWLLESFGCSDCFKKKKINQKIGILALIFFFCCVIKNIFYSFKQ